MPFPTLHISSQQVLQELGNGDRGQFLTVPNCSSAAPSLPHFSPAPPRSPHREISVQCLQPLLPPAALPWVLQGHSSLRFPHLSLWCVLCPLFLTVAVL